MGKLIVIEGLDGSGKATQTQRLYDRLQNMGININKISFPNYNSPSSGPIKMYLDGSMGTSPTDVNAFAASSFYAVDRYCSFKEIWEKCYNDGAIILADRYATSNAIYQMAKLKESNWDSFLNWIEDYEYNKLQLPKPDMVIYLDVPPEVSQKLMTNRYNGDENKKDIHESNVSYLKKCRISALYASKKLNWNIVGCAENNKLLGLEEIESKIFNIVKQIL